MLDSSGYYRLNYGDVSSTQHKQISMKILEKMIDSVHFQSGIFMFDGIAE